MSQLFYLPIVYFFTISAAANIIFPATRYVLRKGYQAVFAGIPVDDESDLTTAREEKVLENDQKAVIVSEIEIVEPTRFDLSTIKTGDNIFIIGKKDSHCVIRKILETHENVPINTIVTPVEFIDTFYRKRISDEQVIISENYSPALIKQYIDYKRENVRSFIIEENDGFVILYNCLNRTCLDDTNLTDLLDNGNVYQSITIISASNPSTLTKVKSSIDYLCILAHDHILYKQIIYDEYIKNLMTYKNFSDILKANSIILIDFKNGGAVYFVD
jgi:hypothetical protein